MKPIFRITTCSLLLLSAAVASAQVPDTVLPPSPTPSEPTTDELVAPTSKTSESLPSLEESPKTFSEPLNRDAPNDVEQVSKPSKSDSEDSPKGVVLTGQPLRGESSSTAAPTSPLAPKDIAQELFSIVADDLYESRLAFYNRDLAVLSELHKLEYSRVPQNLFRVRTTQYYVNVATIDKAAQLGDETLAKVAIGLGDRAISQDAYLHRLEDYMDAIYTHDPELSASVTRRLVEEFSRSDDPERVAIVEKLKGLKALTFLWNTFEIEAVYPDQTPFDWDALRGQYALMEFWNSETPSLDALPVLLELHAKYNSAGLIFVGVNNDDDVDKQELFEEQRSIPWRSISLATTSLSQKPDGSTYPDLERLLDVRSYPTMMLFDPDGKLVFICSSTMKSWKERLKKKLEETFPDVEESDAPAN